MPRGLRLRADDADLAAEQRVQQRRFADVRPADDRGEAAAMPCRWLLVHRWSPCNVCISALRISCAAACSARRRLGPLADDPQAERIDRAAYLEHLIVRLAGGRFDCIARQRQAACLQRFLQTGLGILQFRRARQPVEARHEQPLDHLRRGVEAAVQVDRAEQRFERVGQDRFAAEAAGFQLARAEPQLLAELDLGGDDRERLAAHQARAEARQLALVGGAELAEHQHGDHAVEHRVAEELQPFVVRAAGAAMGQRRFEQRRVAALVAERVMQPFACRLQSSIRPPRRAVRLKAAALTDVDGLVEVRDQRNVGDERRFGAIPGAHREAAAGLLDLDFLRLDAVDVLDGPAPVERIAQRPAGWSGRPHAPWRSARARARRPCIRSTPAPAGSPAYSAKPRIATITTMPRKVAPRWRERIVKLPMTTKRGACLS